MARIPHLALEHARRALARGLVLVRVARGSYIPSFSCERCRMPARCGIEGSGRWPGGFGSRRFRRVRRCGHLAQQWRLTVVLRDGVIRRQVRLVPLRSWAVRVPNVPVISSAGDHVRLV